MSKTIAGHSQPRNALGICTEEQGAGVRLVCDVAGCWIYAKPEQGLWIGRFAVSRHRIQGPNPIMNDEYYLRELRVALDPAHSSHALPPRMPPLNQVLDIGCGAGQTLIAAYGDRVSHGMDNDFSALKLGRTLTCDVRFACASAEALPYRSGHFDMVIARASLPYCNLPVGVKEIARVLKKGGRTWIVLHPFSEAWKHARTNNWKGWLFFGYIVMNSLLFHFAQKQFSICGRCESFTTERGIRHALRKNGFSHITVTKNSRRLVVTASLG